MGAWAIGVFSVAGVVNQIAIALFRRAQAVTEPDPHQQSSPNSIFTSSGQPKCTLAEDDSMHGKH